MKEKAGVNTLVSGLQSWFAHGALFQSVSHAGEPLNLL
jgi:hypothetical protein